MNSKIYALVEENNLKIFAIVIVCTLAGFVYLAYFARTDEFRPVESTSIVLSQVRRDIDRFTKKCGRTPTSLTELIDPPSECNESVPYIKSLPVDGWGKTITYIKNGSTLSLISFGADGVEGGEGKANDLVMSWSN